MENKFKWLLLVLVLVCIMLVPSTVRAQIPGCGSVNIMTVAYQSTGEKALFGYTQSTRNIDGCFIEMQVESWVEGMVDEVVMARGGGAAVTINYTKFVPHWDRWVVMGKHWSIQFLAGWLWNGGSSKEVDVRFVPNISPRPPECATDPAWSPECTPIIVDVGKKGYRLTGIEDCVLFDLNGDGIPECVSWTEAGSENAFLALDRNGNGRIDDGTELFGNTTPAYWGGNISRHAGNGFEALRFLEGPDYGSSYVDGVLDARDSIFCKLLLWTDRNHNGISEPDELQSVCEAGVVSISTQYTELGRVDKFGNIFKYEGTIAWRDDREEDGGEHRGGKHHNKDGEKHGGTFQAPVYDVVLQVRK
jgi:hypothetical protein